jgi:DNA-binding MarR family transcriptional regulator
MTKIGSVKRTKVTEEKVRGKQAGLSESLEDYLETILALEQTYKVARVKDIAQKLGVLRGSVTGALKSLAEKELIHYEPYSFITLTRKGASIAREITRRHAVIKNFLKNVFHAAGVCFWTPKRQKKTPAAWNTSWTKWRLTGWCNLSNMFNIVLEPAKTGFRRL